MTLERAQSRDNSTNEIIANAGLVGQIRDAGKVLGLTEQEAIATLSRTYRKQKRADDATTKQDVLRNFLQSANTTLWVSGMSAKARGYDENLLEGFNAQFAMPNRLVEASLEQIRFFVIDIFWISLIFKMGYAIKRVIPRMGDPPRITLQVSCNLPLLP